MSRLAQDSFISDDEEEVCPLCVEEFDISDKGFKPCPCGYQVCQFCYNNIRQNPQLNGRCPGCRRPYDDESVEYKVVTTEEWRQDHQKQTRREKEKRQKERERKEIEQASRKHLSGMRVIQKNLVYVVGLNPHIPHEELHNTLRGDQFFGQYGKIQKIVVNRRNNGGAGNGGIGVYVTYYKKEDAAKCIAAVDGSMNDGKILRAAYGTTKYCSSYLRNQSCPNPNCMFLHEPGEEADSYTRQDLSTIQHAARQADMKPGLPRATAMVKPAGTSKANEESHPDTPEQSALPPTASWATKASPTVPNSKPSRPPTAAGSPLRPVAVVNQSTAPLAQSESLLQAQNKTVQQLQPQENSAAQPPQPPIRPEPRQSVANATSQSKVIIANPTLSLFENAIKMLSNSSSIKFSFSAQILTKEDMASVQSMPPLFAFVGDKNQNGTATDKQSELQHERLRTASHGRQGSRYNFSAKLNNSEHLLEQQQMMQGGSILGIRPGGTPPPPGLFGNGQVRDGQDLISQLVSGGRLKVSLPNIEPSIVDESLRIPQTHPQAQSQLQGNGSILTEPQSAIHKHSDDSVPSLNEIYSNTNQIAYSPRWITSSSPSSIVYSQSGESFVPADSHISLASIRTPRIPSSPCPPGLGSAITKGTVAPSTRLKIPQDAPGLESPKSSERLTKEPLSVEVNTSNAVTLEDRPGLNMETANQPMQPAVMAESSASPLIEKPLIESPPERTSQPTSPAPSTVSQDAVKSKKKDKRSKRAKKGFARPASLAAEVSGASDSVDDTRSQADTSEPDSTIPQPEKSGVDPLELMKVVVEELDGSNNLTFFKQVIAGSVSTPHFVFSQNEVDHAEENCADEITSEMLSGKKLEQLEREWHASKKDCEVLEKKLLKLIKRNRKLVFEV
ncbi:hypothetical protein V1517DRAFT_312363 [Lipomyces orientalis]|uniref:Uncharacterized protein n=1 Tax=Lipomyces orientalis TaxID=1233043 RepID=A0ACC3TYU1_9ASCO